MDWISARRVCATFDKAGAAGAFVSALGAPCFFPLLGSAGGLLGLGSIPFLRDNALFLIQGMAVLSFGGQVTSYRPQKGKGPLLLSALGLLFALAAYFLSYGAVLVYAALASLTISSLWNLV